MGAKQSKRSVDISGKEAESAGEVAASIAGGEGRLEQLADADALKPQLNGDAHVHEAATEEKQKEVDSGTPENEKDATTEKEGKQDAEPEVAPLTNGESEQKVENGGETTPTSEDGKKPKKEKVKKKWSLRSISFSRKDKPKQEKKSKDEESKTNGEPEKVQEETAEVAPEAPVITETAEEAKTPSETKEDKTPETPVTEPITNGSSTPESPKVETPVVDESAAAAPSPVNERPEPETEPEKLPINGLSLDEPVKTLSENENKEDSKEETPAETTENVPEITIKKEVCVEQMPLIDSTPPPLPANPPPSSVATFAATTMAPELTVASLANTADNAIPPLPSDPIETDKINAVPTEPKDDLTVIPTLDNEFSSSPKAVSENTSSVISEIEVKHEDNETVHAVNVETNSPALVDNATIECPIIDKSVNTVTLLENVTPVILTPTPQLNAKAIEKKIEKEQVSEINEQDEPVLKETIAKTKDLEIPKTDLVDDSVTDNESANTETTTPASAEIGEQNVNNKTDENIIISKDLELPSPHLELLNNSKIKNEIETVAENVSIPTQNLLTDKAIAKEIVSDNTDVEMPPPPAELIEEPVVDKDIKEEKISENSEPDLPAPPADVFEDSVNENNVEKYKSPSISESELPAPSADDPVIADVSVENLPSPPPSVCEEVVSNISVASENNEVILPEPNETELNLNMKTDPEILTEETIHNKDIEQNLKNKAKDSLGNFIETVECNGNVEEENKLVESGEVIAPNNLKEIADIENSVSGHRTAAGDESSCEPRAEVEPTIPQELQPISDKLADLIPEVPEVPQIITETVVETTNDVAVAN